VLGVKAEGSRLGKLGKGPAASSLAPPQGWAGIWEISTGVVVVPARSCGINPQSASLHAQDQNSSELSPVRSIHIILSVYEGPLLLLTLSHRIKYFCFQGLFNLYFS